jgi:uncharacterized membrane protein
MRPRSSYLPAIAALAAGSLLLMDRSRKRRRAEDYLDSLADSATRDVHVNMRLGTAVMGLSALVGGGYLLSKELRLGPAEAATLEESIELDVPVSTAYNQWTQFEDFPEFMATVKSVNQVDDTHMHWRAIVGGKTKEWDSEITEQIPDERIAWRSTSGVRNSGVVSFHKISDSRTRVMLQMNYDPQGLVEKVADAAGAVKRATKGNLKRFKNLLETRRQETGAWRGTITQH